MLTAIFSLLLATSIVDYKPPVNYEISLAGNFGEPRPNHFHGGIDVKTGGVEGKQILSIADGYVSMVTIGIGGFGNAVYVAHPDGKTSVYCHLKRFSPRIEALVRRWQYRNQQAEGEMHFHPYDCPVSQGQMIAISGNTGSSQAPHLHLELHDTKTWNMLDPLDVLKEYVHDGMPPMAHGFMAYPKAGEGVFCGNFGKSAYGFSSKNLTRLFTAWGKVGFGIWANDYMEITYNHYGIRKTVLTVDGKEVYSSDVNNIPVQYNMMINSWGDYEHFLRYRVWYMKSFVEPGNRLPCIKTDENLGWVTFDQEREYQVVYTLTDFAGNSSQYSFIVEGRKQAIKEKSVNDPNNVIRWNRTNTISLPDMQMVIPQGYIGDEVELKPVVSDRQDAQSRCYSFMNQSYPLFSWAEINIRPTKRVKDTSKLYVVCDNGTQKYSGGEYKDGWVKGRVRELGAKYYLKEDIEPPIINPISPGGWSAHKRIVISITDKGSGVKSYKAFIDGQFVLFERVGKTQWLECKLAETPIKRTNGDHKLRVVASDNRNNVREYKTIIRY